jgi:hypothetical protein
MKHLWKWTACAILVFVATTLALAQESLGDLARKERARPKPHAAKVITNEDIPSVDTSSDTAATDDKKSPDAEADSKDKDKAKDKDKDKALSAEEKIQLMEKWKGKIAAQEASVKQLDDQVAQIDRDYKLRMSALYADLGNRLRDQAQWAADEKKFQEDMAAKAKERDAARSKLDDMKDQARREGVEGID